MKIMLTVMFDDVGQCTPNSFHDPLSAISQGYASNALTTAVVATPASFLCGPTTPTPSAPPSADGGVFYRLAMSVLGWSSQSVWWPVALTVRP